MIKRKSTVWNFFDRKNKDEAQCNKCDKIMKSSGGSTTSLILHLKKIHQIDINQDANQPPVKMTRTMEHFLTKKSMEEVSKLAAMDGFSFNSITKSDFIQRNLHSQRGKYDKSQPTSANGVRNMVMNYNITKKEELIRYFKKVTLGIHYSLTLDEYRSIQNKRYININVYRKDNHWSLGLIEVHGSLNSRRTEQFVRECLREFGLDLDIHIVGCTTDGASMMVKFGKEIRPDHQQCLIHCIHLSVIDILY
uniref:BED-type domain-containing protein n=1 Tax=Octopus bimaculoides TaxID=37653 RepID=A0A0L8GLA9_OCTBM